MRPKPTMPIVETESAKPMVGVVGNAPIHGPSIDPNNDPIGSAHAAATAPTQPSRRAMLQQAGVMAVGGLLVGAGAGLASPAFGQATRNRRAEANAGGPVEPVAGDASSYARIGHLIMQHGLNNHSLGRNGLVSEKPVTRDNRPPACFVWTSGVWFSALVGAATFSRQTYARPMFNYFRAMDAYWDDKVEVPGYEPSPTNGGGNDKYYDDNAWLVLSELEAYELTNNRLLMQKARQTLRFVLSGGDDRLGGGIWWHEGHKDGTKNTCITAPAAFGCLRMAEFATGTEKQRLIQTAQDLVDWTDKILMDPNDGLYEDRVKVDSGQVMRGKLTYNSALMLQSHLALYQQTKQARHLAQAKRIGKSSDQFVNRDTKAYRDHVKWSHLMVEADLALFAETGDQHLVDRARNQVDHHAKRWQESPPEDLMDHASIARMCWVMALHDRDRR